MLEKERYRRKIERLQQTIEQRSQPPTKEATP